MSYKIELTDNFKKEAKKLIKKYASLRIELAELGKELAENPATNKPSPYRKLAPLFLKSLIPDGVQQLIPDSAFQQLQEGPSAATLQRREEARQKREERRKRRLAPMP